MEKNKLWSFVRRKARKKGMEKFIMKWKNRSSGRENMKRMNTIREKNKGRRSWGQRMRRKERKKYSGEE